MRIRIGNQTSYTARPVTKPFDYAIANNFQAFEWFPDKKESGAGWTASNLSLVPFVKLLAQSGIKLTVENTPDTTPQDFNELFRHTQNLFDFVMSEHIGMCLDMGHANLCPATWNNYLKFVDQLDLEVPVLHLHMHENYGDRDSHLTLFTGPAEKDASDVRKFMERMIERNFSGHIIFEQWPQPPWPLKMAYKKLTEIIDDLIQKRGKEGSNHEY